MQQAEKRYDLLVFIGRFQPFHNGHKHVVDKALEQADNVLVLVGSANRPRTRKNPWSFVERRDMIQSVYQDTGRLHVARLDDHLHENDFHWIMEVQQAVAACCRWKLGLRDGAARIGLIGHSKDQTSYYLKKFPQWSSVNVDGYKVENTVLDATSLRRAMIEVGGCSLTFTFDQFVPKPVAEWLQREHGQHGNGNMPTDLLFKDLKVVEDFVKKYREDHKYKGGQPYMPIHTTTDAVVIQSGHVLLGRRKFNPGKGLWALPGGFVEEFEPSMTACLRELRQETTIDLPDETLKLAFRFKQVFSDVNRSDDRGRIITHGYLFLLNDRETLPKVKAADDLAEVKWVPLGLLDSSEMYSDHYWIIHKMIDMIPVD